MSRKNVTVWRSGSGIYYLIRGDDSIASFTAKQWKLLGLRTLRKDQEVLIDLRLSGLPKKRRAKRK